MEITDIKIRKLIPEGKLRGIVSITIDDVLAVHDIKIIRSSDSSGRGERLFVAMPSRRGDGAPDRPYRDIVHPIDSQTRRTLEEKILSAYRKALKNSDS
ncbi:MAG: SpoVG family protein [Ruminococcus sp.]|nr:SpoVG family protein [Ruminococcus sp.]